MMSKDWTWDLVLLMVPRRSSGHIDWREWYTVDLRRWDESNCDVEMQYEIRKYMYFLKCHMPEGHIR